MINNEKQYNGRGGWRGGGRPRKNDDDKRKTLCISGSGAELAKLKEQSAADNKTISRYVLDNLLKG